MTITLPYLRNRFSLFNEQYFGNSLPVPRLKVGNARTLLGSLRYKTERRLLGRPRFTDFTLTISAFYDLPQEEIDDTIIHEMIHLFIASQNLKDDSPHGHLFRQKMDEINSNYGRHINVSHRGKLVKADAGNSHNVIAVVHFEDGSIGVMRPSKSRIFEISRTLHLYYKVAGIDWYFSYDPYFDTLPRSLKPRVYKVDMARLNSALAVAIPLRMEEHRLVVASSDVSRKHAEM